MNPTAQRPLAVHVVLQESRQEAESPARLLATKIYARLSQGPRPARIPVHVWIGTGQKGASVLPCQLPLTRAARNAIILLVDQPFFDARIDWRDYFEALDTALCRDRDLLLPVSICGDAHRIARVVSNINCVPVEDPETVTTDERIFQAILTAILGLLTEDRSSSLETTFGSASASVTPNVFLCHNKHDGELLARSLRQYIYEETQLTCFFDMHDIPHGREVRTSIQKSISASCLLVIWTDSLLESRWCQFEIIEARRQQRPLLVVDALSRHSPRIFPFLANMPVVRWRKSPEEVLSALLLELVRARHTRVLFESLSSQDTQAPGFMLHPPDFMEASSVLRSLNPKAAATTMARELIVYPDPPLAIEELVFLREAFPNLHLHSLSEWTALRAASALPDRTALPTRKPILPLSIGLSVSESESWKSLGLIAEHQDDFVTDISRELILLGARLLWGGDLRPGLGGRLAMLVRAYHQADHAPQDHIVCYLAWPIHHNAPTENLQERRAFADVLCLPPPDSVNPPDLGAFNALCFSIMRKDMARDSQARIILGGRLTGYAGRYPGIAEEALETINSGVPLYIVGGFGGAARAVYEAIVDPNSNGALTKAWNERCNDKKVRETNAAYDQLARDLNLDLKVDHEAMLQCFRNLGPEELARGNKLSLSENERLAYCQDIHEIIELLVKGLSQLPLCHALGGFNAAPGGAIAPQRDGL